MFVVRSAVPTDAKELSRVAEETFRDGWADVIGDEFAEAYIAACLNSDCFRAEIADSANHYFALATLQETGAIVGYAKLDIARPAHESVGGSNPVLLQRFYVSASGRGRGVADLLLAACEQEATLRGFGTLWIECDLRNERAWKYYEKRVFVPKGETIYHLPNGFNDQVRVLERAIAKES
jgi:GNAT superfamily N-acetyltransferase